VRASPTGGYARRIWFLYEWLVGQPLDLPNAKSGAYTPVVDPNVQWDARPVTSTRNRVKNNLPGTPEFCPLVFRTETLDRVVAMNLAGRARTIVAEGSWWPHWSQWLAAFGEERVEARSVGSNKYRPLMDAPGSYVLAA
jgi:hypothetical protein